MRSRGNLPVVEDVCEGGMALMPMIGRARMLRSWGGIMDMSMDGSPIIDRSPVAGLYLNAGWCYGGFKATPGSGWCFAHLLATDRLHETASPLPPRSLRHRPSHRREGPGGAAEPALMRIPCPFCGERDAAEFVYRGDAGSGPRPESAMPTTRRSSIMCIFATIRRAPSTSIGIMRRAAAIGWW